MVEFVVSYWNSTSNHNAVECLIESFRVVSYWNSTSNHNADRIHEVRIMVVSYWNSTSNHNSGSSPEYTNFVVSYWNSTSNHNASLQWPTAHWLYLIEILHQTTTRASMVACSLRCILLKFYIKPQQTFFASKIEHGCILLKFYIKPQHTSL